MAVTSKPKVITMEQIDEWDTHLFNEYWPDGASGADALISIFESLGFTIEERKNADKNPR